MHRLRHLGFRLLLRSPFLPVLALSCAAPSRNQSTASPTPSADAAFHAASAQLFQAYFDDIPVVPFMGSVGVALSHEMFVKQAFQDPGTARQQSMRGTIDPMYLNYTLGKLMILKLRADWRAKVGTAFDLRAFHDRLLSYGDAPLPLIRRAMLGEDSGSPL